MSFDEGQKFGVQTQEAPNFKEGTAKYEARVQEISVEIKAAQDELVNINHQIEVAKKTLQSQYDIKIYAQEHNLSELSTQIFDLQNEQVKIIEDIKIRQAEHDNIVLNFTDKQKVLDDSWADFHNSVQAFQASQELLKTAQEKLNTDTDQFSKDIATFEEYKQAQEKIIADNLKEAENKLTQANTLLAEVQVQKLDSDTLKDELDQQQHDLVNAIAAAQILISQADEVAKQKIKNKTDADNNAALALLNQNDASQIKVAKVALNNLQQELNQRQANITQAEKTIGG